MHGPRQTQLTVDGVPMTVRYRETSRVRVRVRPPHGEVRVSAPLRYTQADIVRAVEPLLDWVKGARDRLTVPAADGALIWGERIPLRTVIVPGCRPEAGIVDAAMVVRVPSEQHVEPAIKAWRKRELAHHIEPYLQYWTQWFAVDYDRVTLRAMTTRWGTCNHRTRRLTFSTRLTRKTHDLLELVVVHEIIHLLIANHGKEFQACMSAALPDWRERRTRLNTPDAPDQ